jgi:hypothetical protein
VADADPAAQQADLTGELQGQAELFAAERLGRARRVESPVVDADEGAIEQVFGRGRPKGATNIATAKRLEMFARIGGDPLLASARILAMPTAELAGMLGCTAFDAEKFRQAERAQAMPYVISKRPVDINLDTKTPPALHLHFTAAGPGAGPMLQRGGAVALLASHAARLGQAGAVEVLDPETVGETDG